MARHRTRHLREAPGLVSGGSLFLGDLVTALHEIRGGEPALNPEVHAQVAALLGFEIAPETRSAEPGPRADRARKQTIRTESEQEPVIHDQDLLDESEPPESSFRPLVRREQQQSTTPLRDPVEFDLLHIPLESEPSPASFRAAPPDAAEPHRIAPLPPLFHPNWQRGILTESVRSLRAGLLPNLAAAVESLARLEDPACLPPAMESTLALGAQVLLDMGPGMEPFYQDQMDLIASLEHLVGSESLQIRYFSGTPAHRVWSAGGAEILPYRPPERPRAVLILTDLGRGAPTKDLNPATPADWQAFAALFVRTPALPLVLTPYAASLDESLPSDFPVLLWDRPTRVQEARRVRERVLRK